MPTSIVNIIIALQIALLCGCDFASSGNKHLERQIRSEVIKEASGIASLEAVYTVSFIHFEENYITSDDFYIQKDTVSVDYGFDLDDDSIKVVDENGKKKLKVKLGKGDVLAVNRVSVARPETSHEGYIPKDAKSGDKIDVDGKMNAELDELKKIYGEQNLKYAKENARNFFRILASKYALELDFE